MMRRLAAIALAGAACAAPLSAQVSRRVAADLGVGHVRWRSTAAASGPEALSGIAAGGGGALLAGPAALEVSYRQATLTADSGTAPARNLVEGSIRLVIRPVAWLALGGGPRVRAYAATGGTERWTLWEAGARLEGVLIERVARTDLEVWNALAANTNIGGRDGSALGGAVGLTVLLPQAPVWARLSYAIDHAKLADGTRAETTETIALTLGFGGR